MLRTRFRIVFILLVLILLIVSTLFGVLTYWLEAESLPRHSPDPGSTLEGDGLSSDLHQDMPLDRAGAERPLGGGRDWIEQCSRGMA